MNFNKRQNDFRDIPGFDASRGERIVKALEKLREKIHYLEQSRTSEKSKLVASCNSKDEDLTPTDIQYKLLSLQLQYVRSILRKKIDPNSGVHSKVSENDQQFELSSTIDNNAKEELYPGIAKKLVSTDSQTENYSTDDLTSAKGSGSLGDKFQNAQVKSHYECRRLKSSSEEPSAANIANSRPHYHLNLDDIPFLLGASTENSHSVVAGVQNIIAKMKLHNKVLCGEPKPNATRSTVANSTNVTEKTSAEENSEEVTKLLNDLSRDLCQLAAKQQKLVESIDATQRKKHDPEVNLAGNTQNQRNIISYKPAENDNFRKHRSSSESEVKLHAEVKKIPKMMEKDFSKQSVHSKQSTSTVRSVPSNPSIIDRRKLLRSVQEFNQKLSKQDITWK